MKLEEVQRDAKAVREAIEALPDIIDDFCKASKVSPTRLGYLSVGNPNFSREARVRGRAKANTIRKVLKWIEEWKPEGDGT